jgi:hypothetical protein
VEGKAAPADFQATFFTAHNLLFTASLLSKSIGIRGRAIEEYLQEGLEEGMDP